MFVVTNSGKKITFEDRLGTEKWSVIKNLTPEIVHYVDKHALNDDKFSQQAPNVSELEDAIVRQLPLILLEEKLSKEWYLIDKNSETKSKWRCFTEGLDLTIPQDAWTNLELNITYSDAMAFLVKQHKARRNDKRLMDLDTEETVYMCLFKAWAVFYRVKKTFDDKTTIQSCVLRNNIKNCMDVVAATYDEKIIRKSYSFTALCDSKQHLIQLAKMKIRHGWMESNYVHMIPTHPMDYIRIN